MMNESTSRNNALLQSTTQTKRESNNVNDADLSTNVATAATNLDTTHLEQQDTDSQVSQQTETKRSPQDHSCFMRSMENTLLRFKQLQEGRVPEDLQHLAATKTSGIELDSNDLENEMESVAIPDKKADTDIESCDMPELYSLDDTLIRSKQLQDGRVPEDLHHLAAAKVDKNSNSDSDLTKVMDYVTKQGKKADINSRKHTSIATVHTNTPSEADEHGASISSLTTGTGDIQQQQPQDATTTPATTVSSRPPRPVVLPTAAEDSVRRHYISSSRQAAASRLIAHSKNNSLPQQINDVNSSDLLVAVPVKEDEVHVYAVSHDVSQDVIHKRVQKVQARRHSHRLYFVVFLVVAATVLIASLVAITKNKSNGQQQETELTVLQKHMTQLIVSIMGADAMLLNDASSPYAKALTWLLQSNDKQNESQVMTSTLAQRFYLASFYYDTTTDVDKWTDCNPPNSTSELNQTCYEFLPNFTVTTAEAWLSDSHECDWGGVRCDYHQQIRSLGFTNNNLVGTIPSSVAKFPFLQNLELSKSRLEGTIPLLSNCHHLTYITLDDNMLSGDLSSVWQHRKLMSYFTYNNSFTGSLSFQIGNLVDLKYLGLAGNKLTGTVPSEVGLLDSINGFDIGVNQFRGQLPSTMQLWSMIEDLHVYRNSFTGSIPTFLGQLNKTLKELLLFENSFTGTLPDELFHLTELWWLDVANNELSGTIDARFAQLTSLQRNTSLHFLGLNDNHFTGTIPTKLKLLTDLYVIYLQGNDFHGNVSASLCHNNVRDSSQYYDDDLYPNFTLVADCAKDGNGQAELRCKCCTSCCQADGTQCELQ